MSQQWATLLKYFVTQITSIHSIFCLSHLLLRWCGIRIILILYIWYPFWASVLSFILWNKGTKLLNLLNATYTTYYFLKKIGHDWHINFSGILGILTFLEYNPLKGKIKSNTLLFHFCKHYPCLQCDHSLFIHLAIFTNNWKIVSKSGPKWLGGKVKTPCYYHPICGERRKCASFSKGKGRRLPFLWQKGHNSNGSGNHCNPSAAFSSSSFNKGSSRIRWAKKAACSMVSPLWVRRQQREG